MSSEGGYKGERQGHEQQADENEGDNGEGKREEISDIQEVIALVRGPGHSVRF